MTAGRPYEEKFPITDMIVLDRHLFHCQEIKIRGFLWDNLSLLDKINEEIVFLAMDYLENKQDC